MNQAASHATPHPTHHPVEESNASAASVAGRRAAAVSTSSAASTSLTGMPVLAFSLNRSYSQVQWLTFTSLVTLSLLSLWWLLWVSVLCGALAALQLVRVVRHQPFTVGGQAWLELGPERLRVGHRSVAWRDVLYLRDESDDNFSQVCLELRNRRRELARDCVTLDTTDLKGITGPELIRLIRCYRVSAAGEF